MESIFHVGREAKGECWEFSYEEVARSQKNWSSLHSTDNRFDGVEFPAIDFKQDRPIFIIFNQVIFFLFFNDRITLH